VLAALVVSGAVLQLTGVVDWAQLFQSARAHAADPGVVLALVATQTAAYAVGQAGSAFVFIVGPLYPPLIGTGILVSGSTLGAAIAYLLASSVTGPWRTTVKDHRVFRVLQERSDFWTLSALRLAPGFPHAVINYCAGVLAVPRTRFLASTVLGFGAKLTLYCFALNGAVTTGHDKALIRTQTVFPLVLLALLALAGHRLANRREPGPRPLQPTQGAGQTSNGRRATGSKPANDE